MTFKEKLIKNNVNVVTLIMRLPSLLNGILETELKDLQESYPNFEEKFWQEFNKETSKLNHVGNNIIIYTNGMIFICCIIDTNMTESNCNFIYSLCMTKADHMFRDEYKFLIDRGHSFKNRQKIKYDEI